jgi:hypothetical protein
LGEELLLSIKTLIFMVTNAFLTVRHGDFQQFKNLKYYLDPVEGTVNVHTNKNGLKKIVGVKVNEKEKLNLILKNKGVFLYYSFGFQYYSVSKDLEV